MLAAGEGTRLRPLTATVPKALCPVGNVPLLDLAIERLAGLGFTGTDRLAVNACYLGDQVVAHLRGRAHPSVEPGRPLGTAGGVGNLRGWIDGRGVLVGNVDAYLWSPHLPPGADLAAMLDGWDGRTVRLLGVPARDGQAAEFGRHRFAGFSLLPWADVATIAAEPGNLVRTTWRPAERAGRLTVVEYQGRYLDTGTPADYLAANLHAASVRGGCVIAPDATVTGPVRAAVIGAGATVAGSVTRCVVWPGASVGAHEHLVDAVRVGEDLTVPAAGSTMDQIQAGADPGPARPTGAPR